MSLDITLTPPACEHCGRSDDSFSTNITHNLSRMADALGIYEWVWEPETAGIKTAGQLIAPLRAAILLMKDSPDKYKKFDTPNGWGTYDQFLPWLEELLEACEKAPTASIRVSR
jgi:hypothetical protein